VNPWVELWRTTVSGAIALTAVSASAAILFTALAVTHGGAEVSFHGVRVDLPGKRPAMRAPALPPPPAPPVLAAALPPPAAPATPYLGIHYRETIVPTDGPLGREFTVGATVVRVLRDTPAAAVGLRPGDQILGVDDQRLSAGSDLRRAVRSSRVGATHTLHILRGERSVPIPVTLGPLPHGWE